MSVPESTSPLARRSFMTRLGAGLAAFGGAFALPAQQAAAQAAPGAPWTPTRHPQDDWFDAIPGQHRFFFDTISAMGVGDSITFASNFYTTSKSGYGLTDADNAVVICLRHYATPFAFTDAMWAKYGAPIAERIKFTDPKTHQTPTINVYETTGYGVLLNNRETTLSAMVKRGTHFAVCDAATRAFAGVAAGKLGLQTNAVYEELKANTIPNCHFVASGIVGVNRAQERGYAIQYIG